MLNQHSYSEPGQYLISLTGIDNAGNSATTTIDITVHVKPEVRIISPANGTIYLFDYPL